MTREQIKVDIPDDWMENLKHGRCWCGKDHTEFDKGQKFYCSQKHANDYSKRIKYWSTFKDKVLERDNHTCQQCLMSEKQFKENQSNEEKQYYEERVKEFPEAINQARAIKLKDLQEEYERIMNDGYLAQHIPWQVIEELNINRPDFNKKWFHLEVDHIKAVALGGEMWEEENLQTLCSDCHKIKTKNDMSLIKINRKTIQTVQVERT